MEPADKSILVRPKKIPVFPVATGEKSRDGSREIFLCRCMNANDCTDVMLRQGVYKATEMNRTVLNWTGFVQFSK